MSHFKNILIFGGMKSFIESPVHFKIIVLNLLPLISALFNLLGIVFCSDTSAPIVISLPQNCLCLDNAALLAYMVVTTIVVFVILEVLLSCVANRRSRIEEEVRYIEIK